MDLACRVLFEIALLRVFCCIVQPPKDGKVGEIYCSRVLLKYKVLGLLPKPKITDYSTEAVTKLKKLLIVAMSRETKLCSPVNIRQYQALQVFQFIIQHIMTMSKYGHSTLNIPRAYSTGIRRYSARFRRIIVKYALITANMRNLSTSS